VGSKNYLQSPIPQSPPNSFSKHRTHPHAHFKHSTGDREEKVGYQCRGSALSPPPPQGPAHGYPHSAGRVHIGGRGEGWNMWAKKGKGQLRTLPHPMARHAHTLIGRAGYILGAGERADTNGRATTLNLLPVNELSIMWIHPTPTYLEKQQRTDTPKNSHPLLPLSL
jgi:hypothetical protein